MKPVHPLLVHFPIAWLFFSVGADLMAFFTNSTSLRNAGWWALLGAALSGVLTATAGLFDMRRAPLDDEVHHLVHQHMKVGLTLVTAILALTIWRWTIYRQPELAVSATYLDVAVLTMGLAGFQGWLGGELVFGHGVFVKPVARPASSKGKSQTAHSQHHH